jgi:bacterioferritin-associated ferredoxin
MWLCLCKGVSESDVERAGRAGIVTAEGLVTAFGLDEACCGWCARHIEDFVARALSAKHTDRATPAERLLARLPEDQKGLGR